MGLLHFQVESYSTKTSRRHSWADAPGAMPFFYFRGLSKKTCALQWHIYILFVPKSEMPRRVGISRCEDIKLNALLLQWELWALWLYGVNLKDSCIQFFHWTNCIWRGKSKLFLLFSASSQNIAKKDMVYDTTDVWPLSRGHKWASNPFSCLFNNLRGGFSIWILHLNYNISVKLSTIQ